MKKCLWCLNNEEKTTFETKAHTIPKSLGGMNFNPNVCDKCNAYFGNKDSHNGRYSIEVALKETFNISRKRFLNPNGTKRKVGEFKSIFFDVKSRNGIQRLSIKKSFRFNVGFQKELCRAFKRGMYKMLFEELNRQKGVGYEDKYNFIRRYARFNEGELSVVYYKRKFGAFMMLEREAETPKLIFDRMKYLISNEDIVEVEFLGHVFGLPMSELDERNFQNYLQESLRIKDSLFEGAIILEKLTDIDLALSIMNK